jgi:hypothetical protein
MDDLRSRKWVSTTKRIWRTMGKKRIPTIRLWNLARRAPMAVAWKASVIKKPETRRVMLRKLVKIVLMMKTSVPEMEGVYMGSGSFDSDAFRSYSTSTVGKSTESDGHIDPKIYSIKAFTYKSEGLF